MIARLFLAALLACPFVAFAQKKQIQELQRDMALMQDEVRAMNSKLGSLTVMLEQVLDKLNTTNTTVAVLDSSVKDSLAEQQKRMVAPIATMGSKVDQMADEFRFVRESITDLNSRVGKLQIQISDLKTSVQIMSAPPAPPGAAPSGSLGGAPLESAETLFNNARRDQSGGKLDLALLQYGDFLKFYPNSDLAPSAQFHVGEAYLAKGEFPAAAQAFDLVLEKYPENDKTPDAMFMKAKSLAGADQNRSAARELRALIKKYPDTNLARRAQEELTRLGI